MIICYMLAEGCKRCQHIVALVTKSQILGLEDCGNLKARHCKGFSSTAHTRTDLGS